ncbi:MAG: aldehyde dehydrogenase family protein [Ichthyobacteriaceae bacterium]|nr:aldehyde dehydrogenase family protein [Ichthyobacteriaceae bacterium]
MKSIIQTQNFINNKWFSSNEPRLKVLNKYSQNEICDVNMASDIQVELAITSAVNSLKELNKLSSGDRADFLEKLKNELIKEQDAFIDLIIAEAGKPRGYAKMEIQRCIDTLETAVRETYSFAGEIVPIDYNNGAGKTAFTKRVAIGVILAISPFNFPLNLALHKIAPAIATGNPIILKPAPQSPLTALAFAKLIEKVGLPAGSVNILVAEIPNTQKLVTDNRIKLLSFTGSPEIGWKLKNIAGNKKVQLELGGNAASIVDSSSNWKLAAKKLAIASFLYAGQICISTQRIVVDEQIFPMFLNEFISESKQIKMGDPNVLGNHNGPMISKNHLFRIKSWIEEAEANGADVILGGNIFSVEHNIFENTVIIDTNGSMKIHSEEAFAPVVVIDKYSSFNDALNMVNNSKFGLQASVFTNNFNQIKDAHNLLEVGAVIINDIPGFRIDSMPYGGVKESGLGREGIKHTMMEYTEPRMLIY